MDLHQYLGAIRKFWWAIALGALVGAFLGAFSVVGAETRYQATVTFFVKTTGEGNAAAAAQADQFAQRRVNSYAVLLKSDRLADVVVEKSGLPLEPNQITRMLGATGGIDTVLLTATVSSPTEAVATKVAETVATEFPILVSQVEGQGIGDTGVQLEVISGPTVTAVPPRTLFTIGSRTLLGILVGLAAAVILKFRDTAISGADEVEEMGIGALLAQVPHSRNVSTTPLILDAESHSQRAESFRQLRTNLQFLDAERPLGTMLITSSVADEGKSVSAANLALSLVATGETVLLVEADLRRPGLADLFGMERTAGLTDVLVTRVAFEQVVQRWGTSGLSVLPSGRLPPNPSELLGSIAMSTLLDKLRQEYDIIIIDSPPLLPVADALILAAEADGVIVIVRNGRTNRQDLIRALNSLRSVGARVLGLVLTFVPAKKAVGYQPYGDPVADTQDTSQVVRSRRRPPSWKD